MTVTVVFAGTEDGYISSSNNTYSTARSGGTLAADSTDTNSCYVGQFPGLPFELYESFFAFDLSAIPAANTIDSAVLTVYIRADASATDFTLQARSKTWRPTLTTADWVAGASLGGLTLLATLDTSAYAIDAYNDMTESGSALRTAAAAVTGTGELEIIIASDRLAAGTQPTGNEYTAIQPADFTGTTKDPYITVTHSAPSTVVDPFGTSGFFGM